MRFGLLSTIDSAFLPATLGWCNALGLNDVVVILDAKINGDRDKLIWEERFELPFSKIDLGFGSIYNTARPIPVVFVQSHNQLVDNDGIAALGVAALANVGTPRKLTGRLIQAVPHGIVNVHPGVLPRYRGCSVVEWAMLNGDNVGNTAHFMSTEYDNGPIIEIEEYPELTGKPLNEVRQAVSEKMCRLIAATLKRIETENLTPNDLPQQREDDARFWQPIESELMARVKAIGRNS